MSCSGGCGGILGLWEPEEIAEEVPEQELSKKPKKRMFSKSPRSKSQLKNVNRPKSSDTTVTSLTSDGDLQAENESVLKNQFPASTAMERKRFLDSGRSLKRATEKMDSYLCWREYYNLDHPKLKRISRLRNDLKVWNFAVAYACKYFEDGPASRQLPRVVKFGEKKDLRALDGNRIFHVLPVLIDDEAASVNFHALCIAIYLDLKLDRNSDEKIHVVVDVRGMPNFPSAPSTVLITLIQSLTKHLADHMPERLIDAVVFPVPLISKPMQPFFEGMLDRKVRRKISVIWALSSDVNGPTPKQLANYQSYDKKILKKLEKQRATEFIT